MARIGELDGVAHQIEQNLRQPQRVAFEEQRDVWLDLEEHFKVFFGHAGRGDGRHFLKHLLQPEGDVLHFEPARFYFGKIKDIVDNPQ